MKSANTISKQRQSLSTRDVLAAAAEAEHSSQERYRTMMKRSHSLKERAQLRDILLQKEMNELLLRNMFNL